MFKHYLITRFNLRIPGWQRTRLGASPRDDAWMTQRLELFGSYCLPSVVNQSSRNFQWLIFMDTETAPWCRAQIEAMCAPHDFIGLRYIEGMAAFRPQIRACIDADAAGCSHLITSRIDNDDCLHRDFIATVQSRFRGQRLCVVDLIDGYTLQLAPIVRIGRNDHAFNPFSSLIEENAQPQTIWARDHGGWKRTRPDQLDAVRGERLWMCVVHAQNMANRFNGHGEVDWHRVADAFGLLPSLRDRLAAQMQPCARWRWTSLSNRLQGQIKLARKRLKHRLGLYGSAP